MDRKIKNFGSIAKMKAEEKAGGNLEIEFFICFYLLFSNVARLSEAKMHFETNINDAVFGKRFYIVGIIPERPW